VGFNVRAIGHTSGIAQRLSTSNIGLDTIHVDHHARGSELLSNLVF
jgi:hypothetical protein